MRIRDGARHLYLGAGMDKNRFRTAVLALAVVATAAGAALGGVGAVLTGGSIPDGANAGIGLVTGAGSLVLLVMLASALPPGGPGRPRGGAPSPPAEPSPPFRPDAVRASLTRPGVLGRSGALGRSGLAGPGLRRGTVHAGAVRPLGPVPRDPVVPLAAPAFFVLTGLLLLVEAAWGPGGASYWWATGSCLTTATLTAVWRAASRRP